MPNKRPRGPQPHWRPKRETLRILTAVDAVLDRYRDHLPVSLRQLFYVLLSDGVLAKSERDYKRMCEYVGMARRSGRIDWDVIRDDTQIAVQAPPSFTDPHNFWTAVARAADDYRVDRQAGQPVRLELWCETAGMVPQLVRIGQEFGISCFSGGGFDGLAGKHDAAVRAAAGGPKTCILHLGDYDPSGEHLFHSLAEDVMAFAAAAGAAVEFERIAVTAEQVVTYHLPTAPPKATDRRSYFTPSFVWAGLAEDPDPAVRAAVAHSRWAPAELQRRLLSDADPKVATAAEARDPLSLPVRVHPGLPADGEIMLPVSFTQDQQLRRLDLTAVTLTLTQQHQLAIAARTNAKARAEARARVIARLGTSRAADWVANRWERWCDVFAVPAPAHSMIGLEHRLAAPFVGAATADDRVTGALALFDAVLGVAAAPGFAYPDHRPETPLRRPAHQRQGAERAGGRRPGAADRAVETGLAPHTGHRGHRVRTTHSRRTTPADHRSTAAPRPPGLFAHHSHQH
ncbi:hypothetical protein [Nonomuraea sp. NPDC050202]|uniref:hypothetical protein n=1 Tax=Nonomuraea sp. NPDC050202 TaxID=3155035 RepID=UPI0033E96E70